MTSDFARAAGMPVKPNKYRNRPVVIDGIRFASEREGRRYRELVLLERACEISDIVLQPRFPLFINDVKITTYVADFLYYEKGEQVVEDAKGVRTDVYKIKRALMKACRNITIREV